MGTLLCNNIDFLHNNGESIFEKRVKGKIGIYNTREQSDTITYNDKPIKVTQEIALSQLDKKRINVYDTFGGKTLVEIGEDGIDTTVNISTCDKDRK